MRFPVPLPPGLQGRGRAGVVASLVADVEPDVEAAVEAGCDGDGKAASLPAEGPELVADMLNDPTPAADPSDTVALGRRRYEATLPASE